jgi:hypothetical protein
MEEETISVGKSNLLEGIEERTQQCGSVELD